MRDSLILNRRFEFDELGEEEMKANVTSGLKKITGRDTLLRLDVKMILRRDMICWQHQRMVLLNLRIIKYNQMDLLNLIV